MLMGGQFDTTEQTEGDDEQEEELTDSLIDGLYNEVRETKKKDNYVTSKRKVLNPIHKEVRPKSSVKKP